MHMPAVLKVRGCRQLAGAASRQLVAARRAPCLPLAHPLCLPLTHHTLPLQGWFYVWTKQEIEELLGERGQGAESSKGRRELQRSFVADGSMGVYTAPISTHPPTLATHA